jgi:gliding motility-associated-like protein
MKLTTNLLTLLALLPLHIFAQFPGCPSVDAGADQTLTCNQGCANLTATPFQAGATTSYSVSAIPHTPPIAYNATGGVGVSVGTDDVWSPPVNLPFSFCFYGSNYTSCTIGSNGSIKFGSANAGAYQSWSFTASLPNTALAPVGDIFGVYHDIDPTVAGTVKYYLLGTAPCRILCVVYNNLGHYSCTSLRSTFMMVLYETTNVIDVYVQEKQLCTSWNGGAAIVGIQNPAGTAGIAAPNRNTTPNWSVSTPEAWRFTPSGAPIYSVEWFDGATSLGSNTTITVCPTAPTTYTAKATYTACDGTVIVTQDDVLVTPDPATPSANEISNTPSSCTGANGSVTVQGTGGSGSYTYSIDNGNTYQASGSFSGLAPGNYSVFVQDGNGCTGAVSVTIAQVGSIDLSIASTQNISCNGGNNGSVTTAVSGGTSPFSYSLNGLAGQASGNFTNLSVGNYSIVVTDDNGCTDTETFSITEPTVLTGAFVTSSAASCSASDGDLEVSGSGGTGTLSYSIDNNATTQSSGVFSNLAGGSYTILITDANGCSTSVQGSVNIVNNLTAILVNNTDVSCNGSQDGTALLNGSGTTGPYTYALVGTPTFQSNPSFTGLGVGTYNYVVMDPSGCTDTVMVTISQPAVLTIQNNGPFTICQNGSVSMTVNASGGTSPYVYSWSNNLPNGASNVVNPTQSTTYTATVTDDNGCTQSTQIQVTVSPPPTINAGVDQTLCIGQTITLSGSGGVTYTWNNGVSNGVAFSPSTSGVYVVTGTNAAGCSNTDTVLVNVLSVPVAGVNATTTVSGYPGLQVTFANSSQNATGYNFDFGNGSSFPTSQITATPSSTFNSPGVYTVVLTATNGYCSDTAEVQVYIIPYQPLSVIVPNIFTPNGDNDNDVFFIRLENAVSIEIIIVNRWGEYVATISDLQGSWDGKINGNEASEGVYFYKYTAKGLDGTTQTGHGNIELLR